MPIYEFICKNNDCYPEASPKEALVDQGELISCDLCGVVMTPIMSVCRGYVVGSKNPVRK